MLGYAARCTANMGGCTKSERWSPDTPQKATQTKGCADKSPRRQKSPQTKGCGDKAICQCWRTNTGVDKRPRRQKAAQTKGCADKRLADKSLGGKRKNVIKRECSIFYTTVLFSIPLY